MATYETFDCNSCMFREDCSRECITCEARQGCKRDDFCEFEIDTLTCKWESCCPFSGSCPLMEKYGERPAEEVPF